MTYRILVSPAAQKELRRIASDMRPRLSAAIDALGADPRPVGYTALKGTDQYRIRIGDYRVMYAIQDDVLQVLVVKIGHRRDVYR